MLSQNGLEPIRFSSADIPICFGKSTGNIHVRQAERATNYAEIRRTERGNSVENLPIARRRRAGARQGERAVIYAPLPRRSAWGLVEKLPIATRRRTNVRRREETAKQKGQPRLPFLRFMPEIRRAERGNSVENLPIARRRRTNVRQAERATNYAEIRRSALNSGFGPRASVQCRSPRHRDRPR